MVNRLVFTKCTDGTWAFENEEELTVGYLEKIRVGTWMHWCVFLNQACYLSPGCMDEVREFQRKLGGKR
jgi:hypothetical protein